MIIEKIKNNPKISNKIGILLKLKGGSVNLQDVDFPISLEDVKITQELLDKVLLPLKNLVSFENAVLEDLTISYQEINKPSEGLGVKINVEIKKQSFENAIIKNCSFIANFTKCNFRGATLKANLCGSTFENCDFNRANLRGSIIFDGQLSGNSGLETVTYDKKISTKQKIKMSDQVFSYVEESYRKNFAPIIQSIIGSQNYEDLYEKPVTSFQSIAKREEKQVMSRNSNEHATRYQNKRESEILQENAGRHSS